MLDLKGTFSASFMQMVVEAEWRQLLLPFIFAFFRLCNLSFSFNVGFIF